MSHIPHEWFMSHMKEFPHTSATTCENWKWPDRGARRRHFSSGRTVVRYGSSMTHSCMWHDSFKTYFYVRCMTYPYEDTILALDEQWRDMIYPWLILICDTIHSWYVWRDSFKYVTWLVHTCGLTHSYVWRDSFICVTWPVHMCDMTHSNKAPEDAILAPHEE